MSDSPEIIAAAERMAAAVLKPIRKRSQTDLFMMGVALGDARDRLAANPSSVRDAAIIRRYERLDLNEDERAKIGLAHRAA